MNGRRAVSLALPVAVASFMAPAASASGPAPAVPCGVGEPQWLTEDPFALARLGVADAWTVSRGAGVTVAVVDSGVEADNPHLTDAVVPGISLIPGDPEPSGTAAVNNHGTAIASLVAARPVAGSRLRGVAPEAVILPVRVFASTDERDAAEGNGLRTDRMADGIREAVDRGADIINVSISSPRPDPSLESAVRYAVDNDVLVVASAGNRGDGIDDGLRWPAAYDGVLAVAATTTNDDVGRSVASPAVDVAAPGQQVPSAWFDGRNCMNAPGDSDPQTSWAAGYVSGVAALVAAARPDASAEDIAYRIMVTADRPVRAQRDDRRGWGIVQPYLAMTIVTDPGLAGPAPPGGRSQPSPAPSAVALTRAPGVDAVAPARRAAGWWLLAGLAGVGLLTLARVVTGRRHRPR